MGERFLASLRDAMRLVHGAAEPQRDERWQGALRVARTGVGISVYVLPALVQLRSLHPQLAPELTTDVSELAPQWLSGKLDIAFLDEPAAHEHLRTNLVGAVPRGIYGRPDHPLGGALCARDLRADEPSRERGVPFRPSEVRPLGHAPHAGRKQLNISTRIVSHAERQIGPPIPPERGERLLVARLPARVLVVAKPGHEGRNHRLGRRADTRCQSNSSGQ
ncbi:MAG: hypothetical protein JNM84_28240 [Planctomycetes bacterium]|nr:hypothetical protein [Planctomycetota bacterium]